MSVRSFRPTGKHALIPVLAAAAIGGTVALSQPASAATTANWDAIAQQESGGNWSINTGNGFGGGLQISPATSAALGGPSTAAGIAALPKAAQIALAEKILAVQGPGAWPNTFVSGGSSASTSSAPTGSAASTPSAPAPAASTPSVSHTPTYSHHSAATALTRPAGWTGTHHGSGSRHFFTASQVGAYQTQVAVWQARMDRLGYHVGVDGHYGSASASVARQFQTARHIVVDGIVGPQTWTATFG